MHHDIKLPKPLPEIWQPRKEMSGLPRSGTSSRLSGLPAENRLVSYALAGALLALGAPTGLLLTRLMCRGEFSWHTASNEFVSDGATYLYVAASTTIAFVLFGGVLGHFADRLAGLATTEWRS